MWGVFFFFCSKNLASDIVLAENDKFTKQTQNTQKQNID